MTEEAASADTTKEIPEEPAAGELEQGHRYNCDRCGATMVERSCKIICGNCGHRFDCSDLSIYFD